jgi:two-component system alkaline phosphatase synthesis response regulator PhoP
MDKKRVLVVDDEPDITFFIKAGLEQTGEYEVMEINDATEAVEVARSFVPDVILLDVMMPRLDGGDVAYQIRQIPQLHDKLIIFLTATVLREEVAERRGIIGGEAFIAKPLLFEELFHCMRQCTSAVESTMAGV